MKDIMLTDKLRISDRCKKTYWELDHYRKDDKGEIVKKHDHEIDNFRYILSATSYSLMESEYQDKEKDPMHRGTRIEDDFPTLGNTPESQFADWEG